MLSFVISSTVYLVFMGFTGRIQIEVYEFSCIFIRYKAS